jgi:RNA polymerase sigma-70 factor (ECF subfamily)
MHADAEPGTAAAWLEQLGKGDVGAKEPLAHHLRDVVFRKLVETGAAESDAQEVATDCVHDVMAKLHRYDPAQGSLDAWALGFAKNRMRSVLRERSRFTELREEMAVRSDQHSTTLTGVLAEMEPDERKLLQMRFVDKSGFDEIAEAMGTTSMAARKRLSRLIERLRNDSNIRQALFS